MAFNDPVRVHWTLPAAPTVGCVVALQAVIFIGKAEQLADTNVVYAGVLSLMTTIDNAAAEVLL